MKSLIIIALVLFGYAARAAEGVPAELRQRVDLIAARFKDKTDTLERLSLKVISPQQQPAPSSRAAFHQRADLFFACDSMIGHDYMLKIVEAVRASVWRKQGDQPVDMGAPRYSFELEGPWQASAVEFLIRRLPTL